MPPKKVVSLQHYLELLSSLYIKETGAIAYLQAIVKEEHPVYYEDTLKAAKTPPEQPSLDDNLHEIEARLRQTLPKMISQFPNFINQLILIRVVSCSEFYLNRSTAAILQAYPNHIGEKFAEKPDSLKAQIEAIKGFPRKLSFLRDNLRINLNHQNFRELQLKEIHQTRHILVHNMGIVDAEYREKGGDNRLCEDDERPLPDSYVCDSVRTLNLAVAYLHFEFLKKFCGAVD
jgi:hypothetical protein